MGEFDEPPEPAREKNEGRSRGGKTPFLRGEVGRKGYGVPDTSPEAMAKARREADEAVSKLLKLQKEYEAAKAVVDHNVMVEQTGLGEKVAPQLPTWPMRAAEKRAWGLMKKGLKAKEKPDAKDGEEVAERVAAALSPEPPVVVGQSVKVVEPVVGKGLPSSGLEPAASVGNGADVGGEPPAAGRVNIVAWVEYVAANLDVEGASLETAPAPGAWSLLLWARSERAEFFKNFLGRLMPTKTQIEEQNRFNDDGRTTIGLIDRVLATAPAEVVGKSEQERVVPLPKDRW